MDQAQIKSAGGFSGGCFTRTKMRTCYFKGNVISPQSDLAENRPGCNGSRRRKNREQKHTALQSGGA